MNPECANLHKKVARYKEILENTKKYRKAWPKLKKSIKSQLKNVCKDVGLNVEIQEKDEMANLEALVLSLGDIKSGMSQEVAANIHREMIKHSGSLVYQQLFNGKILVLVNMPFIEGYGQPQPPKTVGIYRPEELKDPFVLRHLEMLVQEVAAWEDYDDDVKQEPNQRIGFKLNFGDVPGEGGAAAQ